MALDINFVSKIYNNRNSYADVFSEEELKALNVETGIEELIKEYVEKKKLILITGNPGDGKTHLIRSIENDLKKYNSFIEYDINEVKDYSDFLNKLNKAIADERPCIIAVNEYPLLSLLEELKDNFPHYNAIKKQREFSIIYNEASIEEDIFKAVVVDLNNRNLLSENIFINALNKLLSLSKQCEQCDASNCTVPYNKVALSNEIIQIKLFKLMENIGNTGAHIVMRDILGFISYIISSGKPCSFRKMDEGIYYYDLIFTGENSLFKAIKQFDPYIYTHPEIDEKIWNGTINTGWIFDKPKEVPANENDPEFAKNLFISLKRKFYFENVRGEELLSLIPYEFEAYFNLLRQAYDKEEDMIRKIVLSINRFFDPSGEEEEKLRVWITHKYELRNHPKVAITNKSYSLDLISIQIPRLPKHLELIDFIPDHFLFRVERPREYNRSVDLKVDINFFRALNLISQGYPSQLVSDNYKFKLYRFMNELASLEEKSRSNEFILRDTTNNSSYTINIRENKYVSK